MLSPRRTTHTVPVPVAIMQRNVAKMQLLGQIEDGSNAIILWNQARELR